jgi:hypothetical protein
MEWKQIGDKIYIDESIKLNLKPFEIRTFKFKGKSD